MRRKSSGQRALVALQKIRARDVEIAMAAVATINQQVSKSNQQLVKLTEYRQEYRRTLGIGNTRRPAVYGDQLLFLQRLDQNIEILQQRQIELGQQERSALEELRLAQTSAESLQVTLEKRALQSQRYADRLAQSLCDESGRMAMARPSGKPQFE